MDKKRSMVDLRKIPGKSITIGSTIVTPITHRFSLGLPHWVCPDKGLVFIHQRPSALVIKNDQKEQVVRILDVNFFCFTLLFLLGLLSLFILSRSKKKEQNDERN